MYLCEVKYIGMRRIDDIYKRLDIQGKGGFVTLQDPDWIGKVKLPERVLSLLQDPKSSLSEASALFCFGGKPLIFFYDNPTDVASLHKAVWNLNEVPVVVIVTKDSVCVYNGFAYEKELSSLQLIGHEEVLGEFSYFKLVTGCGWEAYQKELSYHNRVDYFLLNNIQFAQKYIQKTGVSRNLANRLIGKIIFLRYLTDRHVVLNFEGQKRALTNEDLILLLQDKQCLSLLFETLQDGEKGFNGDLFRITKDELEGVPMEALNVLVRLLRSDNLEDGNMSLFDVYDFSILPVEFISNVYERFIGKENQEREGAYYTPRFLVDYVVENTVGRHLAASDKSVCRILDPACGSGIFLVESLRRIIDHYIQHNDGEELHGTALQEKLRELVVNNIYGIDSDESAIQVAAFSIYLTLLDYQKPADISTFRFPNLIGTNLKCQDSFCSTNFEGLVFDYVIGNPPWNRGRKELDEYGNEIIPEYQKYVMCREKKESRHIVGNKEIAQAFVLRSMDFMNPRTQTALVLTSKVLYNGQSKSFRDYLLDTVQVNTVLELSAVRREVFSQSSDPAIAPACVLFYQKKLDSSNTIHTVTHAAVKPSVFFTLFKVLTIEKADFKQVRQDLLREHDELWKILLYGSYLDFIFVRRLLKMKTIQQEINERKYETGNGVTCGKVHTRQYDTSAYIGKREIEALNIKSYRILPSDARWTLPRAQWGRRPILFEGPLLLIRKGIDSANYSCRAAVYEGNAIYKDAITGVHGDDIRVLRNMAGVLNSRLFCYFALMCMSSVGVERETGLKKEKFSMPYVSGGIDRHVESIEHKYNDMIKNPLQSCDEAENYIEKERTEIENIIARELHLSTVEKALIDYAIQYSIPLATGNGTVEAVINNPNGRKMMDDYAQVFLNRFDGQLGEGNFLNCHCEIAADYVAVRFKVEKERKTTSFTRSKVDGLHALLLTLSVANLSDQLYLRKDIRGFERDGFYVVKPCDQRLWHEAVAYVDVQEFVDAMLSNQTKAAR